jgi:putative nucleotidyltransferase with HDIG domain
VSSNPLRGAADKGGMESDSGPVRDGSAFRHVPAPGEHVRVRCRGFQCLARRDADGRWRSVFGNQILADVLEIMPGEPVAGTGPSIPKDEIDRLLDQVDRLPPAPRVLPRLLSALSDTESNLNQVVELVAIDTILTARLLRACNSVFFGTSQPVNDVSEAVQRLGFQTVYRTVAAVSGAQCLKSSGAGGAQADRLWRHSVTSAFAAQFIAQDAGLDSALLFTAGILHDLGKVVLGSAGADPGAPPAGGSMESTKATLDTEKAIYGFGHAEVGGRILQRWHFSDQLAASVRYHHDPGAGGDAARLAACISLADTIARGLNNPEEDQSQNRAGSRVALDILGLAEEQLLFYDDRVRENLQFIEGMCRL